MARNSITLIRGGIAASLFFALGVGFAGCSKGSGSGGGGTGSTSDSGGGSATAASAFVWSGQASNTAGSCSSAFTVTSVTSALTPVNVTSNAVVTLSGSGNGGFYSDPACSQVVSMVTISSGTDSAVVYFSDLVDEDLTFQAAATGFSNATLSVAILSAAATQLVWSGSTAASPGACSAAYTITGEDPYGNPSNIATATTVNLSGAGNGGFYSDSACSQVISTALIAAGSDSQVVYFLDTKAESLTFSAAATALTSGTYAVLVNAGTPATLVWGGATTATAGICSLALTITSQDSDGNPSNLPAATTVNLSGAGNGGFYTASNCSGSAVTSVLIAANTDLQTVYFRDNVAESLNLSAAATGLTAASESLTVNPGTPTNLVWSGAASVAAGACSAALTMTSQDSLGNPSNVTSSTTVNLSGGGHGNFYLASNCTGSPITSVTITTGADAQTFYFADTVAESLTFVAAAASLTGSNQAFSVNVGAAAQIVLTAAPTTAAAGQSFATQPALTVEDTYGNTVSTASIAITLAAYSDAACSSAASGVLSASPNPVSASSGVATFSGANYGGTAGTIYLGAAGGGFSACSSAIAISAGTPTQLAYGTQPSSSASMGMALATQPSVQVEDAYGNVNGSATNAVAIAAYSDAACSILSGTLAAAANPLSASSGVASFSGAGYVGTDGTIYLGAAAAGLSSACSGAIAVGAGSPAKLVYSRQPSPSGNSGSVLPIQPVLQVLDALGNVVTSANNPITLTAYSNATCTASVGTLTAASNPLAASSGIATFAGATYSGTTGTIYLGASSPGLTSACSNSFTINPGIAATLAFSTEPSSTGNSGTALATQPFVQLRDAWGNNVTTSSAAITLSAYTDAACSSAAGGALAATSNPETTAGGIANFAGVTYTGLIGTIYLKAAGTSLASTCSSAIAISGGNTASIAFSTEPSTSGATGVVMGVQPVVELFDSAGNIGSGGYATIAAYTNSSCTTAAPGSLTAGSLSVGSVAGFATFSAMKYTDATPGTIYLGASSTGATSICSTAFAFTGNPSKLAFSTQPGAEYVSGKALGVQPIVEVEDSGSNLVNSATNSITLAAYTNATCTTAVGGTFAATTNPLAASLGLAAFSGVKYTGAGSIYLKASGAGLTSICSNAISVSADTATQLAFSVEPSTSAQSGTAFASQPTVQVEDAYDNVAKTATNSITLAAYTDSACTVAAGGTFAATTNPLSATAGVATFAGVKYTGGPATIYLRASATGLTSACSSAVLVAGTATQLAFSVAPSANGTSGVALTTQPSIQVQDSAGNLVNNAVNSITLAAYTDSACTVAAGGTLAATTNPKAATAGVAAFAGVKYTSAADGTVHLKASATGLTSTCSSAIAIQGAPTQLAFSTIAPSNITTNVIWGTQPVVQVKDASGNVVTAATNSVTLQFFADSSCTTVAVGVAAVTNPLSAVSGVANFSGVKDSDPGDRTLYLGASATGLTSACSGLIIQSGTAQRLGFSTEPSATATVGSAFSVQPVVQVLDSTLQLVTTASNSVTLAAYSNSNCTSPISGLNSTATVASNGIASFSGVSYSGLTGTFYIRATGTGLSSTCSTAVTVTGSGAAAALAFTTQPSSGDTSGTTLSVQPVVQIVDSYGNAVTSASSTVTLAAYSNSSCSTPTNGLQVSADPLATTSGAATFSGVAFTGADETVYLGASAPGLGAICSNAVVISGAATQLVFSTQPPNSASAGVALSAQPAVEIQDASGNPVGMARSITLAAYSDASCQTTVGGTLNATTNPLTSVDGYAQFAGIYYAGTVGTIYLGASTPGLPAICSNAIAVEPGPASQLVWITQPSLTGTPGTALGVQPSLQLEDAYGNLETSATNTIQIAFYADGTCTNTASPQYSADSAAASNGSATFTGFEIDTDGNYYYKAIGAGTTACSSSPISITGSANAAQVALTTLPALSATVGTALSTQPVIQVEDQFGNLVPAATNAVTVSLFASNCYAAASAVTSGASIAAVGGVGTLAAFTIDSAGAYYYRATSPGLSSSPCSASGISVSGSFSAAQIGYLYTPLSAMVGAAYTPAQVAVEDSDGNVVSASSDSITVGLYLDSSCLTAATTGFTSSGSFTSSASSGVAAFAGTYTFSSASSYYLGATDTSESLTAICSPLSVQAAPDVLTVGAIYGDGASYTPELWASATFSAATSGYSGSSLLGESMAVLSNGTAFMAGGMNTGTNIGVAGTEIFNPGTGTWSSAASMINYRSEFAMATLANGQIMAAGGCTANCSDSTFATTAQAVESYNSTTNTWTALANLSKVRGWSPHAVTLASGNQLICGGGDGTSTFYTDCEIYNSTTGPVTTGIAMEDQLSYYGGSMVLLTNGFVLANNDGYNSETEIFNPATQVWTDVTPSTRRLGALVALPDGRALLLGGSPASVNSGSSTYSEVDAFEPATGTWVNLGNLIENRGFASAAVLPDGTVLVSGGCNNFAGTDGCTYSTTAEIFNPYTGTSAYTGSVGVGTYLTIQLTLPQ